MRLGGGPLRDPQADGVGVECPGSQCSLSLVSILQVAPSPHHDWSLQDDGGGESSRFLRNFTPFLLLNGLFGRQGILLLRLRLLQFGLIEAGDFPHVGLVCHFLKTILAGKRRRLAGARGRRTPFRSPPAPPDVALLRGVPSSLEAQDPGVSRTLSAAPGCGQPAGRPVGVWEGRLGGGALARDPAQTAPRKASPPSTTLTLVFARNRGPWIPLASLQQETKERCPPLTLYTSRRAPPLARRSGGGAGSQGRALRGPLASRRALRPLPAGLGAALPAPAALARRIPRSPCTPYGDGRRR